MLHWGVARPTANRQLQTHNRQLLTANRQRQTANPTATQAPWFCCRLRRFAPAGERVAWQSLRWQRNRLTLVPPALFARLLSIANPSYPSGLRPLLLYPHRLPFLLTPSFQAL